MNLKIKPYDRANLTADASNLYFLYHPTKYFLDFLGNLDFFGVTLNLTEHYCTVCYFHRY
jgi:hypothetical protein